MSRWKSGWAATVWSILMALSVPLPAQAAAPSAPSGDYARLVVPDVAQAVRFFSDVMNCVALDLPEENSGARVSSVLLDCAHGMVLEVDRRADVVALKETTSGAVVSFASTDVDAMANWLRSKHVPIDGMADIVTQGDVQAHRVVRFQAPWGQPLQLIGPLPKDALGQRTRRLAAQ